MIVGITGTLLISLQEYLENVSREHSTANMRMTAILGTAHILN